MCDSRLQAAPAVVFCCDEICGIHRMRENYPHITIADMVRSYNNRYAWCRYPATTKTIDSLVGADRVRDHCYSLYFSGCNSRR